jgi:hypothetical protein
MDSTTEFLDEHLGENVPLQNSAQLEIFSKNVKDERCVQHNKNLCLWTSSCDFFINIEMKTPLDCIATKA